MNPDKLKKTVKAYNGFCAVRHDEEFAKDPAYLREVDKAAALLGNTRLFRPPYGRTWVWQRKALL